jgi:16S rRNA (cytidine1402-2'-O)-methyltransferase
VAGTLYIVATPIGHLDDITLRALRILKEVDLIAAEDTRHTQVLLRHYQIRTALTSYHEHNERQKAKSLVEQLVRGVNIALVADAGTPTIADPGYRIVVEAAKAGVKIVAAPGACALTAVLSASGLPTDRFVFEGFLPQRQKQRQARLQALRDEARTMVFYEAPHRLKDSLLDMAEILGNREMVLGREVTKLHEEFVRGRAHEVIETITQDSIRGEFVIVIAGASSDARVSEDLLGAEIDKLKAGGMRIKEIAEVLGEKFAVAKREVYRMALQTKEPDNEE